MFPDQVPPFAMLGLGDIVIPGIFVALVLRYDVQHPSGHHYFEFAFWGYVVGLATTILVRRRPVTLLLRDMHVSIGGDLHACQL